LADFDHPRRPVWRLAPMSESPLAEGTFLGGEPGLEGGAAGC